MIRIGNRTLLNELSASEGIFTTAQAERVGIRRDVLSYASRKGQIERLAKGAYRLGGVPSSTTDELIAVWKLTDSSRYSWERQKDWDGIVIGGTTAANLQGIGDFYLSPYRIYGPRRINSRNESISFSVRYVEEADMEWIEGLPVTKCERTLVDLCLDNEDPSLIEDTIQDALAKGIDNDRLTALVNTCAVTPSRIKVLKPILNFITPDYEVYQ